MLIVKIKGPYPIWMLTGIDVLLLVHSKSTYVKTQPYLMFKHAFCSHLECECNAKIIIKNG